MRQFLAYVLKAPLLCLALCSSGNVFAQSDNVDSGWRFSGGVSLLPGSNGKSQVGYGLTLSRSVSKRTTYGAEVTSTFGSRRDIEGESGTVVHTMLGAFLSQTYEVATGLSFSAGVSAGAALAEVRTTEGDQEDTSDEAFPFVEPKLSLSLVLPGGGSGFTGSVGWTTLPGESFSEPRFSFGFSF